MSSRVCAGGEEPRTALTFTLNFACSCMTKRRFLILLQLFWLTSLGSMLSTDT